MASPNERIADNPGSATPAPKTSAPRTPAPGTPDGRYFVVRGRLWRCSNPALSAEQKQHWTAALMRARRAKKQAIRAGDREARETARQRVDEAKTALGERGVPWWTDGAPDWNRHMAANTPYAGWFNSLTSD